MLDRQTSTAAAATAAAAAVAAAAAAAAAAPARLLAAVTQSVTAAAELLNLALAVLLFGKKFTHLGRFYSGKGDGASAFNDVSAARGTAFTELFQGLDDDPPSCASNSDASDGDDMTV